MPGEPIIVGSDGSSVEGKASRAVDCLLRLAPRDLTFIRINHQARLQFEDVEVVIEGAFALHVGDVVQQLQADDRTKLAPFRALYPGRLDSADVDADGTLRLGFDHGARVTVPPDAHYEAWQIVGPGTTTVVCLPGAAGELAIWS